MELVIEVAGWVAAGVLLGAYGLLSRGRLSGQGRSFQSLNVVGSLLVGLNSLVHEAWPSVSVNAVWLLIGVATLLAAGRSANAAPASADAGTHDAPTSAVTTSDADGDLAARTDRPGALVGSNGGTAAGRAGQPTLV